MSDPTTVPIETEDQRLDVIANGKALCKMVQHLIFEGVRPFSWLTPETAGLE